MATPITPSPPTGAAKAHRALALTILALVVVNFFVAGLFNFGTDSLDAHRGLGMLVQLLALVVLILAFVGRRDAVQASAILFGLAVLQGVLAILGDEVSSVFGGLHPVNALLLMLVAMLAAAGRRVTRAGHRAPAAA